MAYSGSLGERKADSLKVEHGPPGHRGVTQLMAVGNDGLKDERGIGEICLSLGEAASMGAWLYGWSAGSKIIKNAASAAGLFFVIRRITKK